MKKQVVIINQSSGYLTYDIANAFSDEGFNVTLISALADKKQLKDSINVYSVTKYDKTNILKRIITWFKAYSDIKSKLKKIPSDSYILYFTNPPFSYFLANNSKNSFSIVIYDLYPDALNNIKCPGFIKNFWTLKNRQIFPKALKIYTLSQGMKKEVTKYCDENKIEVINLWEKEENPEIVAPENNKFLKDNGLTDKFIILYSGNMGFTHTLTPLIEVANSLKEEKEIIFVFIGEGGKKQTLINKAKYYNLDNCKFYTYLPQEDLKYSLSAASIGVVSVSQDTANISVPSKTFNLLSYGIPLLALAPEESEINRMIKNYRCGSIFTNKNVNEIKDWILKCKDDYDYYQRLRNSSFETSKHFTKENAKKFVP